MKPPERLPPDDPREWLNRARSSLAMARNRVPDAYLEDICFGAQQAAEKAIKAVMSLKKMAASSRVTDRSDGCVESRLPNTAPDGLKIVAMEASTC